MRIRSTSYHAMAAITGTRDETAITETRDETAPSIQKNNHVVLFRQLMPLIGRMWLHHWGSELLMPLDRRRLDTVCYVTA
ncbi:hypothetical protein F2Q69_00009108 [Brassica cretica]|uniref:Uncharacterized protein n=2 Tax=Brassica cretica TaxID=69181 RepID=A0A8S9PNL9_BRACR|nr:hypothetical protein F2Q69_00009108 [Brassica cretica]KAF3546843.1 hypothetical protein DY000_02009569 [Brassica cretica]